MEPEEKSRLTIDKKLIESGWVIQDVKSLNLSASLGVAVREFELRSQRANRGEREELC